MKRIFSSALVIVLTIGAAQAQTTTKGTHNGHNKEQRMAFDSLNLSADQQARVKAIREDFKKQMADLKSKQLSADEMKTRRRELRQQYQSKFEAVLTPDQKSRLAALKSRHKEGGKKGLQTTTFQSEEKLQQALGLTEEQQQKVSKIRSDFKPKFEALRNDNSLSPDQRKSKMHELRKEQHEQIKAILTPEQIEKMKSLRKEDAAKNTR